MAVRDRTLSPALVLRGGVRGSDELDHRRLGLVRSAGRWLRSATVATLFTCLYPRVMVSDPNFGSSLTVDNASSSPYALKVMTIAALILVPIVLLYQAWTYYVFRRRLGGETNVMS